jgi:hypothetical protein
VICAGVCVNGSALVLCGHDVWFIGNVLCVLYFVYLRFCYVSPLEQVLVETPSLLARSISDWSGRVV